LHQEFPGANVFGATAVPYVFRFRENGPPNPVYCAPPAQ
jgi:hypothetical protein